MTTKQSVDSFLTKKGLLQKAEQNLKEMQQAKMIIGNTYKINNCSKGIYLGKAKGLLGKYGHKFQLSRSIEILDFNNLFEKVGQ